jgi:hypothetical protein
MEGDSHGLFQGTNSALTLEKLTKVISRTENQYLSLKYSKHT